MKSTSSGINCCHKGRAGEIAFKAKKVGIADGGMDTGPDATNSGPKRTNKMLSPGPKIRNHS